MKLGLCFLLLAGLVQSHCTILQWNHPTKPGIYGYHVLRSDTNDSRNPYSSIGAVIYAPGMQTPFPDYCGTVASYEDAAFAGAKAYYRIAGFDVNRKDVIFSNVIFCQNNLDDNAPQVGCVSLWAGTNPPDIQLIGIAK